MKSVLEEFGDNAWSCEVCGDATPPGWLVCGACENRRAEIEEVQHQEEMRALEDQAIEEHFAKHPHG